MYIEIVRFILSVVIMIDVIVIDQCATETGISLHRVPAIAASPTVTWHPSRFVIAYCGQIKAKEGGPPPTAVLSLFGMLE